MVSQSIPGYPYPMVSQVVPGYTKHLLVGRFLQSTRRDCEISTLNFGSVRSCLVLVGCRWAIYYIFSSFSSKFNFSLPDFSVIVTGCIIYKRRNILIRWIRRITSLLSGYGADSEPVWFSDYIFLSGEQRSGGSLQDQEIFNLRSTCHIALDRCERDSNCRYSSNILY